jgi:beta-lactamase superfamily II metal-dependent hydrolase
MPGPKEGKNLTVSFLNVRHGDSVFVISPNNGTMLIDGGYNAQGGPVMHYLRDNGLKEGYLDVIISSNSDPYHVGGIGAVLFNMVVVGEILHNGLTSGEQYYLAFDQFGKQKGIMKKVSEDRTVLLDDNMQINLIVPYKDNYFNTTEYNSIVTKMTYGDVSLLLMSDCAGECEKKIMGNNLKADILKVAHYAWNDSTSKEFLEQVNPKVAIISTGESSEFGVPDSLVLQRLLDKGVKIYRTDINGTIKVTSDGKTYSITTEN